MEKRWLTAKDTGLGSFRIAGSSSGSGVSKIAAGLVRTASASTSSSRSVNSALGRGGRLSIYSPPIYDPI